ncbi:MAG TPA: Ig-like domain-containing protein [Bryobacteraceae bacterium]|jgi:uncharacterized repeat protein (TIGR01451 family)|nr:Ig-like domain-containing protein [Bryobacteraceae bacterium]
MAVQSSRHTYLRFASIVALAGVTFGQPRPEQHRGPFLNLSEGRSVATRYRGGSFSTSGARALSTAAGDFDEDGVPDLVSGFATRAAAGAVTVHRGNVDALWPYGALRGTDPPAFLPDARVFSLPEPPDFLAAGDFDADGHSDIAAAHAGSRTLYWLKGDGHGGFAEAQAIALAGTVTSMTWGDINRADGLTDLIVGITGAGGAQVLVFESPDGALRGKPEVFPLPADAAALAVIPLDGGLWNGIAVAAGNELLLIHARDRRLTRSQADRESVPAATVTRQTLPFAPRSLAVGQFTSAGLDLAALGDDGRIHILERSDVNQPLGVPISRMAMGRGAAGRAVAPGRGSVPGAAAAGARAKTTAMNLRTSIALPLSVSGAGAKLVRAHVAASGRDSLIVIDPAARKLHIVSHRSRRDPTSLAVSASLDVAGPPAAVEPMRINKDALHDLVILTEDRTEPIVRTTAADYIFTVTDTSDGDAGSLRVGIQNANEQVLAASETAEIDFNIPSSDLNRDPTTGVFTIQPIGQNTFVALPTMESMTIDGYTQPGSSPNTLTAGDNAHLLIEINGSLAGLGPSGLELYGNGSVVRGLTLTNFQGSTSTTDPRYVTGGAGIDIESDNNIVEGNFLSIDAGGTFAKGNEAGVFTPADPNGEAENGSTIGGTTPQARNLISGSRFSGVDDLTIAYANTMLVQGNYIGTDKTGTQPVQNGYAGIQLVGFNATIGGTAAGAGNLISGNLDFNVVTEIEADAPHGNLIQGNLIGTQINGSVRVNANDAVGIEMAFSDADTIGGTTPAARNIISGNGTFGINFVGGNENDLVEGNYIGVDITGKQAIPNIGIGVMFGTAYMDVFGKHYVGVPTFTATIGGEPAGAANVISGNQGAGVEIISFSGYAQNNTIAGNLIGTDVTGLSALGNQGDGVLIETGASSNTVGGTDPAAANVIAYNTGNGVTIDPGAPAAATYGVSSDNVIGNAIYSNTGAGVRIPSGTGNQMSQNQIYSNGALGIDIDAAGVLIPGISCQAATGANLLQNAPVLTAGTGNISVSATATDPVGNTSEFSNCVPASLTGNVLSIAGTLVSSASTAYTIEYFSNPSCDASGYGEGKVYLGSATVTTAASAANCAASLNASLDLTKADLSVTLNSVSQGASSVNLNESLPFTAVVRNNGPIAATSVTWTDVLPAGFLYIAATASQGTCSFASGTITCNLGNLRAGGTVEVTAYIVPTVTGAFSNTVSVASGTPDSNAANNSATFSKTAIYNPLLNHLSPAYVDVGSPDTVITLVGEGFTSSSVVTYNGVTYASTFVPNWNPTDCGLSLGVGNYCTALTITVLQSQFTAIATVQVAVVTTSGGETLPFNVVPAGVVPGVVSQFILSGIGTTFTAGSLAILTVTAADNNGTPVPTFTGTVNLTSSDPAPTVFTAGGGTSTITIAPSNAGQQTTIVSLQTFGIQSLTATDAANPAIKGTLGGIVVGDGPASNLVLGGTPQATLPGQPFAAPLTVTVTDEYGNAVPNQKITFTPPATGASAVLSSNTATTNSQGVASVTATANGTSGPYAVGVTFGAAIAGGGDNADVFLLNNGTGLATLTATAGTPQSTYLGNLFATHLQATLQNALGNPISGATVYFNSGSVNGASALVTASATTNASGVASSIANAPSNASAGTFPVTASVGGLTATFTLTEQTPQPILLSITAGSPQISPTGAPYAIPLAVHAANGVGAALPGVVITFIPPASGASATLSAGTRTTDGSGNASVLAIANGTVGPYTVTASVGGMTVNFLLTNSINNAGPPASIAPTAGTPQSAPVTGSFSTPFQVLVKDGSGNPVPGASVSFTAPAGGATGTFAASAPILTNGAGMATAPGFTANTVSGSYNVTARTGALTTTFSLTNVAGAPATMSIYAGNNQSATINTNYGTNLAVQLLDTYGNPVAAGWSAPLLAVAGPSGASGTFSGSPTSVTTNNNGIATAPALLANGTAGVFGPIVLYGSQYVVFNLTNTTAVPAFVTAYAGTPQSASVGTSFATGLSVLVADSGHNPLPGFTVNFTAPTTGASALLVPASAITNSLGIATVNAIANGSAGGYYVNGTVGALPSAPFALTNTAIQNVCDINNDGSVNVTDVQVLINAALGQNGSGRDLNRDGAIGLVDLQIDINAVLNLGCSAS